MNRIHGFIEKPPYLAAAYREWRDGDIEIAPLASPSRRDWRRDGEIAAR